MRRRLEITGAGMYRRVSTGMDAGICVGMCADMCAGMCAGMWAGMCVDGRGVDVCEVCGHVHGLAMCLRRVYTHAYLHLSHSTRIQYVMMDIGGIDHAACQHYLADTT